MKTLIISMTCGEGHNQIAKAINNALQKRGEESKIIQLYGFNEKEIKRQNKLFLSACKYIPHIYQSIWKRLCNRNPNKKSSIINGVIKDCNGYIQSQIEEFNPDAIVCTHNNASAVVDYLIRNNKISKNIKTYSIAFDYCLCPYWEFSTSLDYIVTPHEFMHETFVKKGFKEEQLLPFGLPVDEKFTESIDKKDARRQLGLKEDLFTVALYSGGNCLSKASTLIKELLKNNLPIQIIAICGKNQKEFEKVNQIIKKRNLNNILNVGFCTNIQVVYSASDLVFTRGGGMGLTEQINKHIPFVLREKLIINEKINKQLFTDMGLSRKMNSLKDASKILNELYNDKSQLEEMSKHAKELSKPNSTNNFVDFLLKNK